VFESTSCFFCAGCCQNFLDIKQQFSNLSVPEVFDKTFTLVDEGLKRENIMFSGCTTIAAFLEVQPDPDGGDKKVGVLFWGGDRATQGIPYSSHLPSPPPDDRP